MLLALPYIARMMACNACSFCRTFMLAILFFIMIYKTLIYLYTYQLRLSFTNWCHL